MNSRKSFDFLVGAEKITDDCILQYIHTASDGVCDARPIFIPYEEIEFYEAVAVEFESPVFYECIQKYPLICIRGMCDEGCKATELSTYCFHKLPCTNKRPDRNCWTSKYPNFFDLLFDTVNWMKVCSHMDALIVLFEYTPYTSEPTLDFDYSYALLIKGNTIRIIGESHKVKALYDEYNKRYPTADREIENAISYPEENFHFKF